MKILAVSHLFPNAAEPRYGIFVARQLHALIQEGADVLFQRQVDRMRFNALADLGCKVVELRGAARQRHHLGTAIGGIGSDCPADTTGRAGDEPGLIAKVCRIVAPQQAPLAVAERAEAVRKTAEEVQAL